MAVCSFGSENSVWKLVRELLQQRQSIGTAAGCTSLTLDVEPFRFTMTGKFGRTEKARRKVR